jgi:hypothetical protein
MWQPTTHLHDPVGAHCVRPLAVTRRIGLRARAARPYENPKAVLVFPWVVTG